jgi:hypothetical protein
LLSAHPGLQVYYVDIYSDLNYLLDNYSAYGFTQAAIDALDDPGLSDKSFSGPGSTYVFWDAQHPTTKTHALIAGWVRNALGSPADYPTVAISAPQSGAQFTSPATIPISAAVNPNGWTIGSVLFFHDGVLLGQVNSAPYDFSWTGVGPGTYFLTVQASYGSGQTVGSPSIPVTVTAPIPSPTIAVSAPQNGTQFTAPATIPISATVVPNGWTINSVSFFQDGVLLGQVSAAPYTFSWSGVATGNYSLSAQATYGSGETTASGPVSVAVTAPSGSPLPAPWNHQDIGAVGQPGSASYASGTFTVSSSGADIWGTADAFHYVYQPLTGDGTIVALVTGIQNTDGFAKAGVMFRAALVPSSPNVFQFITPSLGLGFQYRATLGGTSTYHQGSSFAPPYWLKLERKNDLFNGYSSPDGATWTLAGSVTLPMTDPIYVGLAVTAHNNSTLNTATLTNVQIVQPADSTPPSLAVTRSTDGTIQLILSGSIGANYRFDASSDLSTWTPFSTNLDQSGTIQIADPQSSSYAQKFYRAALVQ